MINSIAFGALFELRDNFRSKKKHTALRLFTKCKSIYFKLEFFTESRYLQWLMIWNN